MRDLEESILREYFHMNRENIYETARFLVSKQEDGNKEQKILEKYNELRNDYYSKNGTFHNESLINNEFPINKYLEEIRHSEVENLLCIGSVGNKSKVLFRKKGNQFSCQASSLEVLKTAILNESNFFIVHNHPFVFRAAPSSSDFLMLNEIWSLAVDCGIELLDFSIVTKFDYWSMKQEDQNMNS